LIDIQISMALVLFGRLWSRPRRCFISCLCFVILVTIWLVIRSYFVDHVVETVCNVGADIHSNLLELASSTHYVLAMQNVTHFLCYGTLWGAVRRENLLPWKQEFEFCVCNEDLISMDDAYLRRLFRIRGIDVDYSSAAGVYSAWKANKGKAMGVVNMYVFENVPEEKQMRRVGLNRLIPVSSDSGDVFPSRLIAQPLNAAKIQNVWFPAPREGVEIQKYHYKDNWWQEIKPERCS